VYIEREVTIRQTTNYS